MASDSQDPLLRGLSPRGRHGQETVLLLQPWPQPVAAMAALDAGLELMGRPRRRTQLSRAQAAPVSWVPGSAGGVNAYWVVSGQSNPRVPQGAGRQRETSPDRRHGRRRKGRRSSFLMTRSTHVLAMNRVTVNGHACGTWHRHAPAEPGGRAAIRKTDRPQTGGRGSLGRSISAY